MTVKIWTVFNPSDLKPNFVRAVTNLTMLNACNIMVTDFPYVMESFSSKWLKFMNCLVIHQ